MRLSAWPFVFVGFCVMREVRCLSFVYHVGRGLRCSLRLCAYSVLYYISHAVLLCYCAFSAPMSVICWLSVHGSVCLFERVFPVCCFLSVLGLLRM